MCRWGISCDIGLMQSNQGKPNRAQQVAPLLSRRLGETRGDRLWRRSRYKLNI
jgi:hypothetical protein